jgi:hypothetical protein
MNDASPLPVHVPSDNCATCGNPLSKSTLEKRSLGRAGSTGLCVGCWNAARRSRPLPEAKACTNCKIEKPLSDFPPNKAKVDGRQSRCRECGREWAAQWRRKKPEEARAISQRYDAANREIRGEKSRLRHHRNKHIPAKQKRAVERATAWARENPDRAKVHKENHRAAKLRALPSWASRIEIEAIYRTARLLGPDFHVDHIVPLQGDTVCGLHCEANLQIIPSDVNIAKRNRHWPDMFEAGL